MLGVWCTQLAALRARTAADHFDVAAWDTLVAEVDAAAQAMPTQQILAEKRSVYEALLTQFPTAVNPKCTVHFLGTTSKTVCGNASAWPIN